MFFICYVDDVHLKTECSEILLFRWLSSCLLAWKVFSVCKIHWEVIQDDERTVLARRVIYWLRFFCIHS